MSIVFISHASADKPLVDALFDLLQTGCNMRVEDIACTSVENAGIKTGDDFIAWIEGHMNEASIVLMIMSPNYYASTFCTAEMGAAWACRKRAFPLMLPEVGPDPGVVFLGRQSSPLSQVGLDNLRDAIAEYHEGAGLKTARWTVKRDLFLERLPELLETLPEPDLVPRAQLAEQTERAEAATELYKECELEKERLSDRVAALESVKDAEDVAKIARQFDTATERYEEAVAAAREELEDLDRVEQRALYAATIGEPWLPDRGTWDYWGNEIERATRKQWLVEQGGPLENSTYLANHDHPRYRRVMSAIDHLAEAILDLDEDIVDAIQAAEGYIVSTDNQEYWEEALLTSQLLD